MNMCYDKFCEFYYDDEEESEPSYLDRCYLLVEDLKKYIDGNVDELRSEIEGIQYEIYNMMLEEDFKKRISKEKHASLEEDG